MVESTTSTERLTNDEIYSMLWAMEGQYKILLGHRLKQEYAPSGYQLLVPKKDPFVIMNTRPQDRHDRRGMPNSNMNNETLSIICAYVHCKPVVDCIEPVQPKGHCCEICGAVITFSGMPSDIVQLSQNVFGVITMNNLEHMLWYSFDRVDNGETPSVYQISLVPHNDTEVYEKYDDRVFEAAVKLIMKKLDRHKENSLDVLTYEYQIAKVDRSLQYSSKVIGSAAFAIIVVLSMCVVYFLDGQTRNSVNSLFSSTRSAAMSVRWTNRGGSDDQVELIVNPNHDEVVMEDLSEDESLHSSNPSTSSTGTDGTSTLIDLNAVEDDTNCSTEEMPLIEL